MRRVDVYKRTLYSPEKYDSIEQAADEASRCFVVWKATEPEKIVKEGTMFNATLLHKPAKA